MHLKDTSATEMKFGGYSVYTEPLITAAVIHFLCFCTFLISLTEVSFF